MANNKNKKRVNAPATETKEEKQPVNVIQMGDVLQQMRAGNGSSLSPDGTVQALTGLKQMIHDNPNAAEYYGISPEAVQKLNAFTVMGFATVLAVEIEEKKSSFAIRMLASHKDAINALADFTGVSIDTKALPAPNEKGEIEVPSDAVKVAPDKKKQIKKEVALSKKAETVDVTKITNEEELKASLTVLLSLTSENLYDRMYNAIKFYRAFLELSASKSDNKDAELKSVREISDEELLERISKIVKVCSFSNSGPAKYMFAVTGSEKTIVPAFCMLRRACTDRKTGVSKVDDMTVASIMRVLICWVGKSAISANEENILSYKKNIALLKKNEKANKGAIDGETKKIGLAEENIKYINSVIDMVTNPSFDDVKTVVDNYRNKDSEGHKTAIRIYKDIMETFMPDVVEKDVDADTLDNNVEQYAGIIVNLFKDPLTKSTAYNEMYIKEFSKKAEPAKDEEPETKK